MPTYFACQKMKMGYALSKKGFIIPRKTNVFGEVLESACLSMCLSVHVLLSVKALAGVSSHIQR